MPALNQIETDPFCQQIETAKMMWENNLQLQAVTHFLNQKSKLFESDLLAFIAITYNKTITQVILRWLLQRGFIMLPKSVHKEKIEQNINIFDFELRSEDMEAIEMLDSKSKHCFC
jgi:2,5-diketo-D-gluconate reductase A